MLKYLIFFFTLIGFTSNSFAQLPSEPAPELEISLLTCAPGNEMYSLFGHSALRVIDYKKRKDYVFDFGVFDFDEPNFVLKFLRGDLNYKVAVRSFDQFMVAFQREGRGVIEERWNLSAEDKRKVYAALLENYRPENRYYKYEFMYDNCSTRLRDLMESIDAVETTKDSLTGETFRQSIQTYLKGMGWLRLGIDVLFGQSVDKVMTYREQMFLPDILSKNLRPYRNIEKGEGVFLAAEQILPNRTTSKAGFSLFQPFIVFTLLLLGLIALDQWRPKGLKVFRTIIYSLLGIAGVFLVFMWFGTSHASTKVNWDILWVNPLYLLLLFPLIASFKRYLLIALIGMNAFVLLGWFFIPEALNVAILPLVGMGLFLTIKQVRSLQLSPNATASSN